MNLYDLRNGIGRAQGLDIDNLTVCSDTTTIFIFVLYLIIALELPMYGIPHCTKVLEGRFYDTGKIPLRCVAMQVVALYR